MTLLNRSSDDPAKITFHPDIVKLYSKNSILKNPADQSNNKID